MKFLIASLTVLFSFSVFAQQKMGPEAVEIFSMMKHPQVVDCFARENVDLVNIEIKKVVARCPGCNTYIITGNRRNIDTPNPEKTVISIKGKAVPGTFRNFIQTYTCDIKN
ncbi:hypothetical protein [Peredibacter starrii]|uniref:Uncharacterized protein n=1 Tax=Peredibacter starrii TaxID=28202 RepID=A0AAX4HR81_9BACT|nr:hypothetical protein [Peredibacter starrii]WPU65682.1 hypothetical protein SOO65_02885 [Peredibacter starrii]